MRPSTSEGAEPSSAAVRLENVNPILRVRDLGTSIDYYVGVLGFRLNWKDPTRMASVSRGGCGLLLCEGDQGNPGTWVWIGVADAGRLHEELATAGASVRLPPTNYRWAYEFHGQDPDGHVLRFGSEPRKDRPFESWIFWYRERAGESRGA